MSTRYRSIHQGNPILKWRCVHNYKRALYQAGIDTEVVKPGILHPKKVELRKEMLNLPVL